VGFSGSEPRKPNTSEPPVGAPPRWIEMQLIRMPEVKS
jgi:hypothetical protein